MKYNQNNITNKKTAALRLMNDIAMVDVNLASKLQPTINRFMESIDDQTSDSDKMLIDLVEILKIQDKDKREEAFKNNSELTEYLDTIMKNKDNIVKEENEEDFTADFDQMIRKDDPFEVVDDSDDDFNIDELGDALGSAKIADKDNQRGILDKIQISTKVRSYIEKCLAEFISNKVHASVVAQNVKGYDSAFADDSFNKQLDTAFSKLLDVLVDTLISNFK